MNQPDLYTGCDFARAVVAHLGLDGRKVKADMPVATNRDEPLTVTLTVMLAPDDLEGVGRHMRGEVPAKTSIGELTVKLDTSLVRDAIREMLEPGAMYLPKAAVLKLYSHFDIDVDLVDFGAIVAK